MSDKYSKSEQTKKVIKKDKNHVEKRSNGYQSPLPEKGKKHPRPEDYPKKEEKK